MTVTLRACSSAGATFTLARAWSSAPIVAAGHATATAIRPARPRRARAAQAPPTASDFSCDGGGAATDTTCRCFSPCAPRYPKGASQHHRTRRRRAYTGSTMSESAVDPTRAETGEPAARCPASSRRSACGRRSRTTGSRSDLYRIPPVERAAREPRPAPRRVRVGAPLQLPAGHRVEGRGQDRRPRVPEDRPPRRGGARARPALPRAADRGARPAGRACARRPTRRARPGASTSSRGSSPTATRRSTRSPTAIAGSSTSRSSRGRTRST